MTSRDLKNLEELANRQRSTSEQPHLDREMAELALRTVKQLDESIACAESALRSLATLFEDFTLQKALVGAVGISVTEIRSQLPALREAAKEAGQ